MTSMKDIAREIMKAEFELPEEGFDILWEQLSTIPPLTTPLSSSIQGQHPLAAAGVRNDIKTTAVLLFAQLTYQLPQGYRRQEAINKLQEIAAFHHCEGVAKRIIKYCDEMTKAAPTFQQPQATAYTNEHPRGKPLSEKDVNDWRDKRKDKYGIFIYHPADLPQDIPAEFYFDGNQVNVTARQRVTGLEYRLIRHCIRHRLDPAMRTIPALVRYCWGHTGTADTLDKDFRTAGKSYHDDATNFRSKLYELKDKLKRYFGLDLNHHDGIWDLIPPATYCLIEEETEEP